jgi:glutamine amidotransferase
MIVIVDYGMGNLRSILYKLHNMKVEAVISSHARDIENADKLILPGVGHFARGMHNLKERELIPVLNRTVLERRIPILGICLGMQLFTRSSEEGNVSGLGWIDARTRRFDFNNKDYALRIPHVGWNLLKLKKKSPILVGISEETRFYFTHSYHVDCNEGSNIVATTEYGYDFTSIIQKENVIGTQFHPEKSHKTGMEIIRNFARSQQTCYSPA